MKSSADEDDNFETEDKTKKKVTINKKVYDNLTVKCEWKDCSVALTKFTYYSHVSSHLKDLICEPLEDGKGYTFKCSWSTCYFSTTDGHEIIRHVKYHGYHAELKALGAYVAEAQQLPKCIIQSEYHVLNIVDESPNICQWDDCTDDCQGIQEFIYHVGNHVKLLSDDKPPLSCQWRDCGSKFPRKAKLMDHIKTHTKQHFIACPHCGHTFANKTKFADHCLTQKPLEEHVYQCDYCNSYHPTERILRKHMGQHINHYKCPFCNMTCSKPSLLCKHIRYRHLNYRSFKCSLCDFKCKSKGDLQSHILSHVRGFHSCQEPECTYTTTSQLSMKKHIEAVHVAGKELGLFCCHICDKTFARGVKLTAHLSKKHNLKKPPGYSRFQYKLDGDGCRRLQSVRLESLEVHEISELTDEDDPDPVAFETPGGAQFSKAITVDILGDSGNIISSSVVIPEESLPPDDAEIIAVGT